MAATKLVTFADGKVAGIMSAGLFEDPDNPTEEEMTSNAAVAVAPVAEQAEWIRGVVGGEGADSSADASPEAEAEPSASWRNVAIGLGVLALVVAGFLVLLRRRSN